MDEQKPEPPNDPRRIDIQGKVTIKQGDEIIFESKPNKITLVGLKCLASMFICNTCAIGALIGAANINILFGKGTGDTISSTTALTTSIAVNPIVITSDGILGASDYYYTKYIASWSAATLNAQLTGGEQLSELGLFMGLNSNVAVGWTAGTFAQGLFARVPLGTDSFVPDINKPVAVEWEIGVQFV